MQTWAANAVIERHPDSVSMGGGVPIHGPAMGRLRPIGWFIGRNAQTPHLLIEPLA